MAMSQPNPSDPRLPLDDRSALDGPGEEWNLSEGDEIAFLPPVSGGGPGLS